MELRWLLRAGRQGRSWKKWSIFFLVAELAPNTLCVPLLKPIAFICQAPAAWRPNPSATAPRDAAFNWGVTKEYPTIVASTLSNSGAPPPPGDESRHHRGHHVVLCPHRGPGPGLEVPPTPPRHQWLSSHARHGPLSALESEDPGSLVPCACV